MGEAIHTMHFKYRGVMDWPIAYDAMRSFWYVRGMEFYEDKYKFKGDEVECEWHIEHKIDAYNMIRYDVAFKAFDLKPITHEGKEKYFGKIHIVVWANIEEHFKEKSAGGKREIFRDEDEDEPKSWLHKIYKKMTWRDRNEFITDNAHIMCHDFIQVVKENFNIEAK